MTSEDFLFVYSARLYHFLRAGGQRYVCTGLHERSHNKFWLFAKNDEVRRLLDEYDRIKEGESYRN